MMWGLSLHCYTIPGTWQKKGSATKFTEEEYIAALRSCLRIEQYIKGHSAIMDRYDPQKRVALVVDEWGIWTDVEPGTNPGFLYQQNSLRDALIAATSLNIFNNHCERVKMANLAQTVNVLQALILTDKEKMLLTPTYHVFDMYKVHHDATWLPLQVNTPDYVLGDVKVPAVNASASRDKNGAVHITLVNLDPKTKSPLPRICQISTGSGWKDSSLLRPILLTTTHLKTQQYCTAAFLRRPEAGWRAGSGVAGKIGGIAEAAINEFRLPVIG